MLRPVGALDLVSWLLDGSVVSAVVDLIHGEDLLVWDLYGGPMAVQIVEDLLAPLNPLGLHFICQQVPQHPRIQLALEIVMILILPLRLARKASVCFLVAPPLPLALAGPLPAFLALTWQQTVATLTLTTAAIFSLSTSASSRLYIRWCFASCLLIFCLSEMFCGLIES